MAARSSSRHIAVHVQGVVQGVGFRPFVFRIATARGLAGWVRNGADGVRLEVRGPEEAVADFLAELRHHPPPQARIWHMDVRDIEPGCPPGDPACASFRIVESAAGEAPRPCVPADLATCGECAAEIASPGERRFRYPFTNCTQCGPRYTIVESLPYDRARTAMASFGLCADCEAEYRNPRDRRFHAQPIACPACGPRLELLAPDGARLATGPDALDLAAEALVSGRILALKGLGGFQLLVDATSGAAVARLRLRKRREAKPFAVMFPSTATLAGVCRLSAAERAALEGTEAPIVLVARRPAGPGALAAGPGALADGPGALTDAVAPGNPRVGAMLPCTPLHLLLMGAVGRPLVCTSGNLSGEALCTESAEAVSSLGGIADLLLTHDRPVLRPVDDSVVRIGPVGLEVLRRARGFAPLPVPLGEDGPAVLGLGAHLKSTIALARGREATISQHLGDLGSANAVRLLERTVDDLLAFHAARPDLVACDMHPDYASTHLAERLAARWEVPLVRVQHHHAHALAVMAEHGVGGDVLALTWDGAGYGSDGTIWGGEALLVSGARFRRVASLRTFRLPGGEAAAREPRRALLGLLAECRASDALADLEARAMRWFGPDEARTLEAMLARGVNCPVTTSMGRLFDAISSLVGLRGRQGFEGEAAMALEFAADSAYSAGAADADCPAFGPDIVPYALPLVPADRTGREDRLEWRADWEPLLREAAGDLAAGASAGHVAARFHASLAYLAVAIAREAGVRRVVLAGGCFQNLRLARLVRRALEVAQFEVFSAQVIPPNDGGISLGQIVAARREPGVVKNH